MKNKILKKKWLILSAIFIYIGLLTTLLSVLILVLTGLSQNNIRFIGIAPGVIFLIAGGIINSAKCACPYCGYGRGKNESVFSFKGLRIGKLVCPKCKNEIDIT